MACSCSKYTRRLRVLQDAGRLIQPQTRNVSSRSTVDSEEVAKFSSLSEQWWDSRGEFAPLHHLNALRIPLVQMAAGRVTETSSMSSSESPTGTAEPRAQLRGLKVLDIGCGGGLLSEPMARLGASVLGLDASQRSIDVAQHHSSLDSSLAGQLEYRCGAAEDLPNSSTFDVVIASEVIEHVSDQRSFVDTCCHLVRDGGSLVFTTLNKTCLAYYLGIVAAESLGIAPSGTHEWDKFISPDALSMHVMNSSDSVMRVELSRGMTYNPVSQRWTWSDSMPINYALVASKISTRSGSGSSNEPPTAESSAR